MFLGAFFMATGKFIKSKKDLLDRAYQFHTVTDEKLRIAFMGIADMISEEQRLEVLRTYNDAELASAFRTFRQYNSMTRDGWTEDKNFREIYRIPAGAVYEFLCAYFEPLYGKKWMRNKKAIRHEFMRPWWIVNHI